MSDLISRQQAIDAICTEGTRLERNGTVAMVEIKQWCVGILEALPSAQPERKKAKWIDGQCSNCGCDTPAYIIDWKWQKDMDANFCPNCGADMRNVKDESKN